MLSRFTVIVVLAVPFVATCHPQSESDRSALPTDRLEVYNPPVLPGEPPPIKFAASKMSSAERRAFLTADYKIVEKVADLPTGIRKLYMANDGSHIAIADPGDDFNATDIIVRNLPSRRLIFAGVTPDRAFIHYEMGGIWRSYMVVLFRLESPDTAVALWRMYCDPAQSLEEIKLMLEEDRNSLQAAQQFRSNGKVQWQNVDQLCGSLRFKAPVRETITWPNGKVETRLYLNVLKNADVELYRGTPSDKNCCKPEMQVGRTESNEQGRFELPGFQRGWYWLRIEQLEESSTYSNTMPLRVTSDFNDKSCRDAAIGRIFTLDARPPKVETRIY